MLNKYNALYIYGIAKFGFDLDWKETGINGKNVYIINAGNFSALVHYCEEKPYTAEEPEKLRKLILAHNKVLDRAMEDFDGIIPLPLNTIIRNNLKSAEENLKKWLNDDQEKLEDLWNKITGKKEYGLRVYYDKEKLIQGISANKEIRIVEKNLEGKSQGLSYLLESKMKSKMNEMVQERINQLKQNFYNRIKKMAEDIKINTPKIFIDEGKDLLMSLSILSNNMVVGKIDKCLERNQNNGLSFQWIGPFAPYSFIENGK